jgi:hypothetical protein
VDEVCGALSMEIDTGLVWRRFATEAGDTDIECLGFVGDESNMPPDLWREWEWLLDRWNESVADGADYEATVAWSYYDRLGTPGVN